MAGRKKIHIETKPENKRAKDVAPGSKPADQAEKAPDKVDDPPEALETRLKEVEKESAAHYDQYLRVSAEFENYKKRSTREITDFRKFANESIVKEMLSVVDNLERALDSVDTKSEAESAVAKGVRMTHGEILKVFEKFAVKPIQAINEPFDPVYHQAVMQEENEDQPDNTVIRELQKGYLMHDRLLRASMVVVSKSTGGKKTDTGDTPPAARLKKENEHTAHQNPDARHSPRRHANE